jgi:hypothetical protein
MPVQFWYYFCLDLWKWLEFSTVGCSSLQLRLTLFGYPIRSLLTLFIRSCTMNRFYECCALFKYSSFSQCIWRGYINWTTTGKIRNWLDLWITSKMLKQAVHTLRHHADFSMEVMKKSTENFTRDSGPLFRNKSIRTFQIRRRIHWIFSRDAQTFPYVRYQFLDMLRQVTNTANKRTDNPYNFLAVLHHQLCVDMSR